MNLSSLPISSNLHTRSAEAKVLAWGRSLDIVRNEPVIIRYKVLWFAGYALPHMDKASLERAMKFFLCLHHLDEMQENCVFEEAMEFFHIWCEYSYVENYNSPFSPLSRALADILLDVEHLGNMVWNDFFWFHMDDYLRANTKHRILPDLDTSINQAGFGSGIFLASLIEDGLNKEKYPKEWVAVELCRNLCLSNDNSLFEKFQSTELGVNELVLRQSQLVMSDLEIAKHGENLLLELLRSFSEVVERVSIEGEARAQWAEKLHLLLGGCLYWSEEGSLRYGTKVNGISKT